MTLSKLFVLAASCSVANGYAAGFAGRSGIITMQEGYAPEAPIGKKVEYGDAARAALIRQVFELCNSDKDGRLNASEMLPAGQA